VPPDGQADQYMTPFSIHRRTEFVRSAVKEKFLPSIIICLVRGMRIFQSFL
jgi:hypothetical protein